MGGGAWFLWVLGLGWVIYMAALATGRAKVGRVRDARDAMQSRWLIGGLTIGGGLILAATERSAPAWLLAVLLALSGAAVIQTARRYASSDPTNRVDDDEVRRAARNFIFDSRPPARGAFELFFKRRWNVFVAVAALGFTALLVGLGVDTFLGDPADLPAKLAFLLGMSALFLLLLIGPSAWWLQRAIRGIPMARIDSYGITMGRDRLRDLSMAWDDMESVEVRILESSGMRDRLLIVHPRRPGWLAEQPRPWRLYARLSRVMYGGEFAISTMALTVSLEEVLARVAAFRPSLVSSPSPENPAGDAYGSAQR